MACGSYCRCGCGLRLRPVSSWRHAPTLCLQRPPPPLASVALFKYRIKSVSDNCKAHCQPDWPISLLLYLLSLFSFSPYTFLPPHLLSFLPCPLFHLSLWLAITQINVVCGKLCKRRHNRNINAHCKQRVVAPRAEGMGGGHKYWQTCFAYDFHMCSCSRPPTKVQVPSSVITYTQCALAFKRSACEMQIPLAAQRVVCAMQVCMNDGKKEE